MKRSLAVDIGLPFGLLVLLCLVSFAVGQFPVSPHDLFAVLWAKISGGVSGVAPAVDAVVWRIRLPRIAAAVLVGAALSGAGSTYQGLFRNPLVSPDILGVAAGAGLGAVLGIFLSASILWVELLAFAGGLGAVAIVYLIGTAMRGRDPVLVLVLAGVAMGTLLGAAIALVKVFA
ncbi:MAG: iron chelate uptake ABC transporter family permease subunit, partial [Stellaceae bacterium]